VSERPLALVKGAGDLATGVGLRLHSAGFAVFHTELAQPAMVRRAVSFGEAVYEGRAVVEGVEARLAGDWSEAKRFLAERVVPVLVDPGARVAADAGPLLVVDAILAKRNLGTSTKDAPAVVALGPGFQAGRDCHAVVETMRGHTLGRVIWQGEALPNTGIPGEVGGKGAERVLRAPVEGEFVTLREIGDQVKAGEIVAEVAGVPVRSALDGVLRGLARAGLQVQPGMKVGDVDPRAARQHCFTVSDKALAIAGGVLEAACALLGGVRFQIG
jgi:xanthine dehydrogenase accessory factor